MAVRLEKENICSNQDETSPYTNTSECINVRSETMTSGQGRKDAGQARNTAQHQCDYCRVTFSRSEHLKRHQTMHNKLKAFACPFCSKRFARSDVLNRHYQSCQPAKQADRAPVKISQRVNRACSSCRVSKVRCSGSHPCDRCCSMGRSDLCQFTLRKSRHADGNSENTSRNQDITFSPEEYLSPYEPSAHQEDRGNSTATGDILGSTAPAVDQQTLASCAPQQTPEPSNRDGANEPDDGVMVDLGLDQATLIASSSNSLADISFQDGTADIIDPSDLGPGMNFDLDPLDWGLLDNSLMAYQNDGQNTTETTSSSPNQGFMSSDSGTGHPDDIESGVRPARSSIALPAGIDMMQISPLEAHRIQILQYLEDSNQSRRRWESWLSLDNMSLFICSYFSFFHQHTPLLHLPFWNVTTSSTPLIFSIVLMGSMYAGNLKAHSSRAQQLCHLAQSFAWESDPDLETKGQAQLDTIQAVYITVLLEAFYFPSKKNRPGVSMTKLVNEARKSGIFQPIDSRTDPWKLEWTEWSTQECRIRTAFILYLFDAIQAILFDRRPELQLHELNLPLPCDENIFSAPSKGEWQGLYQNAPGLTRVEYPVVLSLFLCHRPIEMSLHFSVMGAFIILHGILLHMWEQRSIHMHKEISNVTDAAEQHVREHLAAAQSQVTDNALQLWRVYWNRTVSRPASMETRGLYRDRALVYWFLGNAMNRRNGSLGVEFPTMRVNGQGTLKIPRLLRSLSMLIDSGQLDGLDAGSSNGAESLDCCLRNMQGSEDAKECVEEVDTVILSCMMREDHRE